MISKFPNISARIFSILFSLNWLKVLKNRNIHVERAFSVVWIFEQYGAMNMEVVYNWYERNLHLLLSKNNTKFITQPSKRIVVR